MSKSAPQRKSRQIKSSLPYQCPNERERWTIGEKKSLLDAIERHGYEDVAVLQTCVPSRSCKEIEWIIRSLLQSLKTVDEKRKSISPFDKWVNLVSDLVADEEKDFSSLLADVMAVVSHHESVKTGREKKGDNSKQPNYSRIYQYIESILLNKNATDLSPLDAAVVLDLLHGLTNQIQQLHGPEVNGVKALLLWKYQLLTAPVIPGQAKKQQERTKMALENAWTGNTGGDTADETRSPEPRPGPSHFPVSGSSISAGTQTEESPNNKMCQTSDSENEEFVTQVQHSTRSPRKRKCGANDSKKPYSQVPPAVMLTATADSGNAELHPLTEAEVNNPPDEEEVETPKKVDRRRRTEPRTVFKKPVLFTLNPLCVPVSMLNLRPNTGS
ncbi:uncharacterized protein LOC135482345 [Liolophura sinensis]|uniref:uncharacterized protein LOC135482345 n=1 Tax=Liolophura sinensis TaxID=3198878 RepID=UPI0031596CB5